MGFSFIALAGIPFSHCSLDLSYLSKAHAQELQHLLLRYSRVLITIVSVTSSRVSSYFRILWCCTAQCCTT